MGSSTTIPTDSSRTYKAENWVKSKGSNLLFQKSAFYPLETRGMNAQTTQGISFTVAFAWAPFASILQSSMGIAISYICCRAEFSLTSHHSNRFFVDDFRPNLFFSELVLQQGLGFYSLFYIWSHKRTTFRFMVRVLTTTTSKQIYIVHHLHEPTLTKHHANGFL